MVTHIPLLMLARRGRRGLGSFGLGGGGNTSCSSDVVVADTSSCSSLSSQLDRIAESLSLSHPCSHVHRGIVSSQSCAVVLSWWSLLFVMRGLRFMLFWTDAYVLPPACVAVLLFASHLRLRGRWLGFALLWCLSVVSVCNPGRCAEPSTPRGRESQQLGTNLTTRWTV